MFCEKCGNKLDEGAAFCGECGTPVQTIVDGATQVLPQSRKAEGFDSSVPSRYYSNAPKKKNSLTPLIIVLVAVIVISGGVITYMLMKSSSTPAMDTPDISETTPRKDAEPTPTQEPTLSPTPAPAETASEQMPYTGTALIENPAYLMFDDSEFNTYCAYPSHFISQSVSGKTRLSLVSPDGRTTMKLLAEYNTNGTTVEWAMNEYQSYIGGEAAYKANGDTWFAMSIEKDGMVYYRKLFVDDINIRCFDFICPKDELNIYNGYVNYIEDNFKRK